MSISYTEVEESELSKKAALKSGKEFVRVNVDSETVNQLPFPRDYEFVSCFLPKKYVKVGDRILNFKVRPDDIWVSTFPKAGTTWAINIVVQLLQNIDFSTDFLDFGRHRTFEYAMFLDENSENGSNDTHQIMGEDVHKSLEFRDEEPSPRLLKSHLPAHLMPKDIWTVKPKLIYVYRDAKDVAISMYHMYRKSSMFDFQGTLEDFFDLFLNDHVNYGPFYGHIRSFQQLSQLDHVLLLSYEQMSINSFAAVKKISEFLNYSYSDEKLMQLTEHVSFQNMRKHYKDDKVAGLLSSDFNFFRKGKAGGYRDEMSAEYIQKFDEWNRSYDQKNNNLS